MDSEDRDAKLQAFADALNSGANLQPVDAAELKAVWEIVSHVQKERPGGQVAIDVRSMFAMVPNHRVPNPTEGMALMTRASLLSALLKRGALSEFESDGELNEIVFRAAATMPVDVKDIGEAVMQMHSDTQSESRPGSEEKFLAATRNHG